MPDAAPHGNCAAAAAAAAAADQLPKGSTCGCGLVNGELPAAAAATRVSRRSGGVYRRAEPVVEAVAVAGGRSSGKAVVGIGNYVVK